MKLSRLVLRAEAAAGGMRALARLLGVSPSTIHKWRTEGPSARGHELLREVKAEEIIERVSRGEPPPPGGKRFRQVTYQEVLGFDEKRRKQSEAAVRGWKKRNLRAARAKQLGPLWAYKNKKKLPAPTLVHGKDRNSWHRLKEMMLMEDKRFLRFMEEASELGFTDSQLLDEWFSPEM